MNTYNNLVTGTINFKKDLLAIEAKIRETQK